jgi:hypothetical protein
LQNQAQISELAGEKKKNHPANLFSQYATRVYDCYQAPGKPGSMKTGLGGQEWIRTTEVVDSGFTVRPIWPLWNLPE